MKRSTEQWTRRTVDAIRRDLERTAYAENGRIYVPGFHFGKYRNWLEALDYLAKFGEEGGPMKRLQEEAANACR